MTNTVSGQYQADWSLLSATLTTRKTYRIRALLGTAELSAVSVDVVRGRWALTRSDGTLAPLVAANSLPLRFALAMDASGVVGPNGGRVALSDGAALEIAPGALQGEVAFRLRRAGVSGASQLRVQKTAVRQASSTIALCQFTPYTLDITNALAGNAAAVIAAGDQPAATLTFPTACPIAQGEILYAGANIDGTGGYWKKASVDPQLSSLATLNFSRNELLALNRVAKTTLEMQLASWTSGSRLSCVIDNETYPRLVQDASATASADGSAAIVLVHGWMSNQATCEARNDAPKPSILLTLEQSFGDAIKADAMPGAKYFRNLLDYLKRNVNEATIYTYTYPTYRPFDEPGADLALKLDEQFGSSSVKSVVLVAHSMGGLVARYAAKRVSEALRAKLRIITLATPHLGTPAPSAHYLGFAFLAGLYTPGAESLLESNVTRLLPSPELEVKVTPIIAYGGNMANRCVAILVNCFPDPGFDMTIGWYGLYEVFGRPDTDGAVPITSALPAFIPSDPQQPAASKPWAAYSHRELLDGRLGLNDPLYASIAQDLHKIFTETSSNAVQITTLGGTIPYLTSDATSLFAIIGNPFGGTYWDLYKVSVANGNLIPLALQRPYATRPLSDGAFVYWFERYGTDFGSVQRVPVDGGAVETLTTGQSFAPSTYSPFALDENFVYFVSFSPGGNAPWLIRRVLKSGGPATELVTSNGIPWFTLSNGELYYLDADNAIKALSLSAGTTRIVAANVASTIYGGKELLVSDGVLYFSDGVGTISSVATTGGTMTVRKSGLGAPNRLTRDGAYMFMVDVNSGNLNRCRIVDFVCTTVRTGVSSDITIDGTNIYWGAQRPAGGIGGIQATIFKALKQP